MKLTTTATTPLLAFIATMLFSPSILSASSAGWRNITFHSLPSSSADDALRCAADQHGYGAAAIDAASASPVPLADCRRMLDRTLLGSGVWDIEGLGDGSGSGGGAWSWLASEWSCTFFVAAAAASEVGTGGMSFTIGTEDVRNAVEYVVDNFDLGDGTVSATRGRISGCPGATTDVEWLVWDGQNQPAVPPPT